MSHLIAPSILNSDFLNLSSVLAMLNQSEADFIHLDIMDGVFVPNLTFGFPVIRQIKTAARKPLDVHLMIVEPERHLKQFRDAGANILTVHYEACRDLGTTLEEIVALGMKPSVSLRPSTPVGVLKPFLDRLYMVLIMTVEPGYGGQEFLEHSYQRIEELKSMIELAGSATLVQADGGIGPENLPRLREAGVNVFVVGTSIFRSEDPIRMIRDLKHL